jgi:hypothetical protein
VGCGAQRSVVARDAPGQHRPCHCDRLVRASAVSAIEGFCRPVLSLAEVNAPTEAGISDHSHLLSLAICTSQLGRQPSHCLLVEGLWYAGLQQAGQLRGRMSVAVQIVTAQGPLWGTQRRASHAMPAQNNSVTGARHAVAA